MGAGVLWGLAKAGVVPHLLPGLQSETPVFTTPLHVPDLPMCGSHIGET